MTAPADTNSPQPSATPSPGRRRIAWLLLQAGMWAATVLLLLILAVAWLWPGLHDRMWWPIEVINYFVFAIRTFAFHIGLAVLGMIAVALTLRQWRLAAFVLVPVAGFLFTPEALWMIRATPPAASPPLTTPPAANRPDLIVYSHNAYLGQIDPQAVADSAREHDADVVIIQEAGITITQQLQRALATTHPHFAREAQTAVYGHAVFSRLPFAEPSRPVVFADEPIERHLFRMHSDDGQQRVVIRVGEQQLVIQNIHLVSPSDPAAVAEQDRQIIGLINTLNDDALLAPDAPPTLLIGDFNATPRSITHARLRKAGLREIHAAVGTTRGTTWPANSRWAPRFLEVRIDNAWANHAITPIFSKVIQGHNSDHRGIIVGFDLKTK